MLVCKFKSTKYLNADIVQPISKMSLQKCNHDTLHKSAGIMGLLIAKLNTFLIIFVRHTKPTNGWCLFI